MTKTQVKKPILVSFDDDLLVDTRRVLFKNNITLQQYFTFVIHKLVLEDPSAQDLLSRAVTFNEESLGDAEKDELMKISAANLYSLFEKQDQQEEK